MEVAIDILKNYGPWAICAIGWWLERQERQEKDRELGALTKQVMTAMSEGTNALREFRRVIGGGRD